ncbi:protein of unknown function [Candidatus Methylomirabilis oxygeniifera]|uniref:Uncharacterized protein n=1 Tax=Methylomirabilis oxygeniifera TaxID=671143 RepID=D5MK54_METO1|nr:protein of unknown function [Candidatus Methylomirabilis oxyfera]
MLTDSGLVCGRTEVYRIAARLRNGKYGTASVRIRHVKLVPDVRSSRSGDKHEDCGYDDSGDCCDQEDKGPSGPVRIVGCGTKSHNYPLIGGMKAGLRRLLTSSV